MSETKTPPEPTKKRTVLQQLAPFYIVVVLAFYAWVIHVHQSYTPTFWPLWIATFVAALLIPLLVVINRQAELKAGTSSQARTSLAVWRAVIGFLLIATSFLIEQTGDISHIVGTYYANHGLSGSMYNMSGTTGIPSADSLSMFIVFAPIALGSFILMLGRGKLWSTLTLFKLVPAVGIAAILGFALWLQSWK